MSENKKHVNSDSAMAPYFEAATEGQLLLKRCADCDKTYYYPRPICPFCMSDDTTWVEASGGGQIYSWSVQRRADPVYVIAFVTLDEGPTMMTNIIDCDLDSLEIGQKVSLVFEQREGQPVPVFRLA